MCCYVCKVPTGFWFVQKKILSQKLCIGPEIGLPEPYNRGKKFLLSLSSAKFLEKFYSYNNKKSSKANRPGGPSGPHDIVQDPVGVAITNVNHRSGIGVSTKIHLFRGHFQRLSVLSAFYIKFFGFPFWKSVTQYVVWPFSQLPV